MACQLLPLKPEGRVGLLVLDVWSQTINGYIKFVHGKGRFHWACAGITLRRQNISYITSHQHITCRTETWPKDYPRALLTFQLWFWRVQPVSWNFKFQIEKIMPRGCPTKELIMTHPIPFIQIWFQTGDPGNKRYIYQCLPVWLLIEPRINWLLPVLV